MKRKIIFTEAIRYLTNGFFLFRMKNILVGIIASVLFIGCNSGVSEVSDEIVKDNSEDVVTSENLEEDAYRKYVQKNKIKNKKAWAYQYKFGEPNEQGILVYETNYDGNGNIQDSLVYNSNKVSFHEKYTYNEKNELIVRVLIDSLGKEVQRSERMFNESGKESGFAMYANDSLYYKQLREYNNLDELIRLTEYDASGEPKMISEFSYNENSDLLSQTELDNAGNIVSKISYNYDGKGNKIGISNYNSTGVLQGKTLLKEYENGNAHLVEKYDAFDSLYASYQYEYNEAGEETKNIILNGIGQVIRQSNTTIDEKGNKILFEIFEGEVGFLGKDEVKYNEQGQEIELIVFDNKNQQVKRKLTVYNEKGLNVKEENFNKIDEPIYQFKYEYNYFK